MIIIMDGNRFNFLEDFNFEEDMESYRDDDLSSYIGAFTGESDLDREESFNIKEIQDSILRDRLGYGKLGYNTYDKVKNIPHKDADGNWVSGGDTAKFGETTGGVTGALGRYLYKKLPGRLGEVVGSGVSSAGKAISKAAPMAGVVTGPYGMYSGGKEMLSDDSTGTKKVGGALQVAGGAGATAAGGAAALAALTGTAAANFWNPIGWGSAIAALVGGGLGFFGGDESSGGGGNFRGIHEKWMG